MYISGSHPQLATCSRSPPFAAKQIKVVLNEIGTRKCSYTYRPLYFKTNRHISLYAPKQTKETTPQILTPEPTLVACGRSADPPFRAAEPRLPRICITLCTGHGRWPCPECAPSLPTKSRDGLDVESRSPCRTTKGVR